VATVALNAAKNAGILAAQILGCHDDDLQNRMIQYKTDMAAGVAKKYERLDDMGYENYVKA
jgi:5-(carboxyamino)imidazole ribonucleotide mutase